MRKFVCLGLGILLCACSGSSEGGPQEYRNQFFDFSLTVPEPWGLVDEFIMEGLDFFMRSYEEELRIREPNTEVYSTLFALRYPIQRARQSPVTIYCHKADLRLLMGISSAEEYLQHARNRRLQLQDSDVQVGEIRKGTLGDHDFHALSVIKRAIDTREIIFATVIDNHVLIFSIVNYRNNQEREAARQILDSIRFH